MKIVSIDPYTDSRWCDFIERHDAATIFYHPDWIHLLEKSYAYPSRCLAVVGDDDRIAGLLPLLEVRSRLTGVRGVCLPFSDTCMPLLEQAELMDELICFCSKLVHENRWSYLEIRGMVNHPSAVLSSLFKTHIIKLDSDSDRVLHSFKETRVRQVITKAIRNGVRVERRHDAGAMKEFIRLNARTRKKLGVPLQPEHFFWNFQEHLIGKNHGFVSLAKYDDKIIAASVFLHFKRCMFEKYNASDERFLIKRPNHLVLWDAIKWGCDNGYRSFDCGRTDLHHTGLLEFKRGWGATESDLPYYRLSRDRIVERPRGDALRRVQPLLKKTPLPFLKLVGKLLYRHVG